MSVTVPASVIGALGGLTRGDPPVVFWMPGARGLWAWCPYETIPTHTYRELRPDVVCVLPQSSAALRRVLARHLGWTLGVDEVPPWAHAGAGVFSFGGKPGCDPAWFGAQEADCIICVPGLEGIRDPMEALAVVLAHLAKEATRATRASEEAHNQCPKGCGFALSDHSHFSDECPSVTFQEAE